MLASNIAYPGALALDTTDVFWVGGGGSDPGYMMKCAKAGCDDSPTSLLVDQPNPVDLVVDGGEIFWTLAALSGLCSSDGMAMHCDAADCEGTAEPLVLSLCPHGLAVDDTQVYLAELGSENGTLERCARSGCNGNSEELAQGVGGPSSVAVSGNTLVWTTSHELMACDKAACVPQALATGPGILPIQVATDQQFAYWTNADGSIMKCALAGCNNDPQVLATGIDMPYEIVTDGIDVVWSTAPMGPGGIYRIAADGSESEPTTVVVGENVFTPSSLAIDELDIYWTDLNTGLVAAIPRCR